MILLLAELLGQLGCAGCASGWSLGTPGRGEPTRDLQDYLREHERVPPRRSHRIDLNPLRASTPTTAARARDGRRAAPARPAHRGRPRALRGGLRAARRAGGDYEVDPTLVRGLDYYTRTVFEFTSDALGAQSGVGGGGRYDGLVEQIGGPPTPGWVGGRRRADAAGGRSRRPSLRGPLRRLRQPEYRREAFRLAADARRAGHAASWSSAGRSLKGQLKQADRAARGYVAILGDEGDAQGHGDRRAGDGGGRTR